MSKIVKFPTSKIGHSVPAVSGPVLKKTPGSAVFRGILVVTVLLWPLLKYVVILDCVFQFFRMQWFWDTPGTFAGFKFMFHFAVLVALTCFVSIFTPKGF